MDPIPVMINGLPGKVATEIARTAVADPRLRVLDASLTGPEITAEEVRLGERSFRLIGPGTRREALAGIRSQNPDLICVDFTHPSAVNDNAEFYCSRDLPFVMGTTGGDRLRLEETVAASSVPAVIAPNMAKQIVGFQAMLEYAAENFPGLFAGFSMRVRESHQQGKADTSGTAKAVVAAFNRLGVDFSTEMIHKERDPQVQGEQWGIPPEHLGGHGWHTYSLQSADGSVRFEFTHNVNGREVYVRGTLDAVCYLQRKVAAGSGGRVFTMIDVLRDA
jgi:4-hydroxy-tetrahydrodipicolinate reductase